MRDSYKVTVTYTDGLKLHWNVTAESEIQAIGSILVDQPVDGTIKSISVDLEKTYHEIKTIIEEMKEKVSA